MICLFYDDTLDLIYEIEFDIGFEFITPSFITESVGDAFIGVL